jgi:hypothetical protein
MSLGKKLFIGSSAAGACSTDSVNPFDDGFTSSKALYQFDGNANDTAGSYNATASSGVTYTSGYIGQAATMGGNDSINTNDGGALLGDTWSISFFVKFNNANDYEYIAANWRSNPTPRITNWYLLKRNSSNGNVLEFNVYGSNGPSPNYKQFIAPSSSAFTSNTWYHIAISFNGSSATDVGMYINGLPVSYTTATGSGWGGSAQISTTLDTTIGAHGNSSGGSNYLDGQIDQVRFFNKAISDAEAVILGNETTDTASDVNVLNDGSGVALYSLDYDASDAGGNYGGTPSNVTFGVDGQINYGASFNGSSSYITTGVNSSDINMENTSFSCWVNFTATSGTIMDNGGAVSSGRGLVLETGSGYIVWQQANGTSGQSTAVTSASNSYNDGDWHHVVGTIDGNRVMKLYIDGNVESSTPTANSSATSPLYTLEIGRRAFYNSQYFNGKIDQVRIFKKSLSQNEVDTLYAETACVYTSTTDTINYQGTNLAYYKLDGNALDETSNNYDGGETNITYEFGRYGNAAVFNGSNSYISPPSALANGLTTVANCISFWFYIDAEVTSSSANNEIMTFAGSSSADGKIALGSTSGHITNETFSVTSNTSTGEYTYSRTNIPGGWNHAVVQWNSGDTKWDIFINGVQHTTYTNGTNVQRYWKLRFGKRSSLYFTGKLDQVRIFDSALDATAIGNLYNEKPEVNTSNFETVLYNGTSSDRYVSTVGFQPDLVWIKRRNSTNAAVIQDSVRGENNYLMPSSANAQASNTSFDSFEANGFELTGSGGSWNNSAGTYVAWCWKGGGNAINNTNGNITSQVSANQDAGFSIVKYTGSGSVMTIGHGLSSAPELIIFKSTNTTQDWLIATTVIDGSLDYFWDATAGFGTATKSDLPWSVPDSSVINFGSSSDVINNLSGTQQMIAYCFHSVAGYQKVGSYNGTGSSAANTISFGFAPSFVMIKRTDSAGGWRMFDNVRSAGSYPVRINHSLRANLSNAEYDASSDPIGYCSFTNDGLSFSTSEVSGDINANGGTYIYLAIA